MSVDDMVDAIVLSVDQENEKISLGIKQMEPDPWMTIEDKYPIGRSLQGKVRNLTAFGSFVELEEGIDGLVHISDMSWTKRVQHPSEIMKKGDIIKIVILKIDNDNRRISLGYKQLTEDPWPELAKKLAVGTESLGTITKIIDRGVIVDLGDGVEGFVPASQLGAKDITDPAGHFSEGDSLPLEVIEFDQTQHKVVLSVSAYYKKRERSEYEEFLAKHSSHSAGASIADALPSKKPDAAKSEESDSAQDGKTGAVKAESDKVAESPENTPEEDSSL